MPAEVESMMYVREKPWHGLGTEVTEAPTSADALRFAGLDWSVRQEPVFNSRGGIVKGYKANVRDSDSSVLGIVSDRYKVVQNADAFKFTDDLIGGDVRYETAGSLREGKQIWLLAKMPERRITGDSVEPYLCFTNSHDGGSGVKVCMTPIRVVCNNTLNIALSSAKRIWSLRHTENVHERLEEARDCLFRADEYMDGLVEYADYEIRIIDKMLYRLIQENHLRPVVFHSLRHSSTSLKLKLSKGNIKAVQGDTGHAEARMVTDTYAHGFDEDRKIIAHEMDSGFFSKVGETERAAEPDPEIVAKLKRLIQEYPELLSELLK